MEVLFFVLLLLSEPFFFTVLSVSLLSADEDAAASDVSDFDVRDRRTVKDRVYLRTAAGICTAVKTGASAK